jgi:hypothetical protein
MNTITKLSTLALAIMLGGCVDTSWRRYDVKADCSRVAMVCVYEDCYYCAEADLNVARGCLKTHWYYQVGTDPLQDIDLEGRKPSLIRYGAGTVVTITMIDQCSMTQRSRLLLRE